MTVIRGGEGERGRVREGMRGEVWEAIVIITATYLHSNERPD